MTEMVSIHDEGPGDRYFHIMLNMADDELDPYEYRLLGHYRRVCGARNVPCTESTRVTAERCKMSVGKVSETRQRLALGGWITLAEDGNRVVVTLVDRMPENVQRYSASGRSPGERSPHEQSVHQANDAQGMPAERSPREQDVHQVNDTFTTRTICSPGERAPYIEKQQKQEKPLQTTPPTAPADLTTAEQPATPAAVGGGAEGDADDDLVFVLPAVRKLHLNAEAQGRLLALGAQRALAVAFAATAKGVRNPAGLAVRLMESGGPSDADLERAALALELRTLDVAELDSALRRRQYARMTEQTVERVLARPDQDAAAGVAEPPGSEDGLDDRPAGCRLTLGECWAAALGALSLRLNRSTFENFFVGLQPVSYADGVLTVRATRPTSYTWLSGQGRSQVYLDAELTRVAGVPLRVHLLPPAGYTPLTVAEIETIQAGVQQKQESSEVPQSEPALPVQSASGLEPDGEEQTEAAPLAGAAAVASLAAVPEPAEDEPVGQAEPTTAGAEAEAGLASAPAAESSGEPLPPLPPEIAPEDLPALWQQTLAVLREEGLPFSLAEVSRLQVAGYAEGVVTMRAATARDYQWLEWRGLTLGYVEGVLRRQANQPLRLRLLPPDPVTTQKQEVVGA